MGARASCDFPIPGSELKMRSNITEPRASARAKRRSTRMIHKGDLNLLSRFGSRGTRRFTPLLLVSLAAWLVLIPSRATPASDIAAGDTITAGDADIEVLRASQEVFRAVIQDLRPSLVRIETVGGTQPGSGAPRAATGDDDASAPQQDPNPFFVDTLGSRFVVADGPSTGIVYSSDGYIITSSFNFVRRPALISVLLADGRRLAADLIARDQVRKIALLKVDAVDLTPPQWAPLSEIRIGQYAVALGLALSPKDPSITVGTLSALNRMRGYAVQTDAKLSPANYGGPLCDIHGRVIGITVPMAQRPGELAGVELYDSGIGFAVPKGHVDAIVDVLKTGRSLYRGWLGIQVNARRSSDALMILNVADPSPMREAGVRPGDLIRAADGRRIRHFGHLVQTLYMIPAGEPVYLCLERDGHLWEAEIKMAHSGDLGPLPELEEFFDPSNPFPAPDDE